jgi:hypothetical protein
MSNSYVGPIQPFTGGMSQENFGQMCDHVTSWNADVPVQLIKRRINLHLRQLQDLRVWAGLMVRGEFYCPQAYTTGTITAIQGSDIIQGTSTAWSSSDAVNTTMSVAVTAVNELQEITPASMAGIGMGDWVLFDDGGAHEEFVLVHSVTSTTLLARPTKVHSAAETITMSSKALLQLRVGFKKNFYTIIGITSDQRCKLDHVWTHPAESGSTYQIMRAYVTFPTGLKMVWSVVNITQGWEMKKYMPQDLIQRYDAWRAAQSWPSMLVNHTPDHIGRIRYELWPSPTAEQGIPYLAARFIPNLSEEEDCPPTCIPSGILVNHAIADVCLHDPKSTYYDPRASREFREQAQQALIPAIMQDDNVYMDLLQWQISKYNIGSPGADFYQSHDYGDY